MNPITIVVIDDHPLFRQGVADAISLEPDFEVLGQSSSGEDGLELIRKCLPHVAIVDVNLPGLNGQQVARQVVQEKIPTKIVLLTAYDDVEQKKLALRVGASAYCTKDVNPEELIRVIRVIHSGDHVVSGNSFEMASINKWLLRKSGNFSSRNRNDPEILQPLSSREMEVLAFITRGLSNKEIATILGISHQTVKNHVTAVLRKLEVEDRTQAAVFALRRGWVQLHKQKNTQE